MHYIDTSVIISYLNENDVNHSRALETLKQIGDMVISQIVTLELRSVLARTTNLNEYEIEAYIEYLSEIKLKVSEIDFNDVFSNAEEIAFKIKMRTLDILHLSACMMLNANTFVTFDHEFAEKKNVIAEFGLNVLS